MSEKTNTINTIFSVELNIYIIFILFKKYIQIYYGYE